MIHEQESAAYDFDNIDASITIHILNDGENERLYIKPFNNRVLATSLEPDYRAPSVQSALFTYKLRKHSKSI